jgi:hypothetical protein
VRPEAYDRAMAALDVVRERAADPAEVAEVVGEALHAAHPRFHYRTSTAAVPFAMAARLVSVRDRVVRSVAGL